MDRFGEQHCAVEAPAESNMKILHITAHLGGGAGKAIAGMAIQGRQDFPDEHRIVLLQRPEKSGHVRQCRENSVAVQVWEGEADVLKWADVIVISWWNHPVMAGFLRSFPCPDKPLLLWSHVNGCHYPFLTYQFAEAFDRVLFTSPYSFENRAWTETERREIREIADVVFGMGQFDAQRITPKADHGSDGNFVIGYAGTMNYGKLHPAFVDFCKEVCARVPSARFVMAGDRETRLEWDIQAAGLADRFTFPGFVPDTPAIMRTFDVFGYPLNPEHYGTTENVLLEAMSCGVPPVVLRQNVEQFIVPEAGEYLTCDPEEYAGRIEYLWKHPARRVALGRMAREYVLEKYDVKKNTEKFRAACEVAIESCKRSHDFSFLGDSPWQWLLYCAGEENRLRMETARTGMESGVPAAEEDALQQLRACPPIFREARKSSLRHFAAVYPEDRTLQRLSQVMEGNRYGGH